MTADQVTNYMKGNEIHVQMSRFNYFTQGTIFIVMSMCDENIIILSASYIENILICYASEL